MTRPLLITAPQAAPRGTPLTTARQQVFVEMCAEAVCCIAPDAGEYDVTMALPEHVQASLMAMRGREWSPTAYKMMFDVLHRCRVDRPAA
jgi:hypothetical protein